MATLLRFAKGPCKWTQNDLLAYNITVAKVSAPATFNDFPLPQPTVSPAILNNLNRPAGHLSRHERLFFQHLERARGPNALEVCVDDFHAQLLHLLCYDDHDRMICQKVEMTLPMGGILVPVKPNICVLDANQSESLLVVENKVSILVY